MRSEIALCMLWLAGMLLWLTGYVYSAEVTGAALILLALLYFPFGFYFFPVQKQHNLIFSVVAGSLLFMAPLSLLFALLRFPSYRLQAGIGFCILPLLLFVTLMLLRRSPPRLRPYYKAHLVRAAAWLLVVIFLLLNDAFRMPAF